ncbi:ABC transporter B family member 4-like [Dorcoceras hygrometricum]|uniref:ABC transporter B family member 4-like n=1 Tax=Dorcoceras hygrometricum TaxID=472368 RepID=A0A2Z7C4H2_9LAMI|nr:ABC transporter B family member 4-like [Dorcoceras hygrometricum]
MAEVRHLDEETVNGQNQALETADCKPSGENEQIGNVNKVPFYKLYSYADSTDHALMAIGLVSAVGSGLCLPLMTLLFGELANSFGSNVGTPSVAHEVSKVSLKFVYLAVGCGIAAFLQVSCWMITGERQAVRIRNLHLEAILRQDIGYFDKEAKTGEIMDRMTNDTILIQDAIGEKVASFTGEKQAITKYEKSLYRAYEAGVHEGLAAGLGSGVFMLVLFSSYALAIWFGAKMIIHDGYSGGDVLNIIMAVLMGSFSLGQVSPCLSAFAAGQVAALKIYSTISRKPEIDPITAEGRVMNDIKGDVELKDVDFSYPSRPNERIFIGFSLRVPNGTTLALVGESGSGKSTVLNLVERFYDPQAGEVLIDDINIKEFQLRWIRGKIALVSQEPVMFASSIRDNISYGKCDATIEEVETAVQHANAAKFIDKLPQGLDSVVGQNGIQLSGGQKQRIALARAILKDPRILLLDEATSALDAESERVVQEALDRVMITRTTLIVAHRLSTVKNADAIAVIQRGKIVEEGSHSELTQNHDGAYSRLIRLQEFSKASSQNSLNDHCGSEITADSGQHSSQHITLLRSISQGSSETGNSSRHSFSLSMSCPTPINELHSSSGESKTLTSLRHKVEPKIPLYRLARLNKPEIPELLLGSIAAGVSGAVLPLFGLLFSSVVATFYESAHKLQKDAKFWAFMFVVLGLVSLLATPLKTYFFSVAGCKLIKRIRLMCFEKVVHMEISWFDRMENSSSSLCSRLSTDATSVRSLVGDSLGLLVQNIATAVVGLVISFLASWQLSLIVLFLLPLIGLHGYLHMKFITGFSVDAKTVALVGESGCGKSTILSLLQRFYDPDAGQITLDGVEVRTLKLKWLRQQMGLVSQEPILFNDTIRANIMYGKEGNATESEIFDAAELANAHKFISSLQEGYHTMVGERGIQLSGGQKQRVAIARAILKGPRILLLDEATSALDAESEKVVQDALDRVILNRTTVIVAHRLSTIVNADVIAVVKNGVIAEEGTHEGLITKKDGIYASLVTLQDSGDIL